MFEIALGGFPMNLQYPTPIDHLLPPYQIPSAHQM